MQPDLTAVHERIDHGIASVAKGEPEASERTLEEARALCEKMRADLVDLEWKTAILERDVGLARYAKSDPWRRGYDDRMKGIQPATMSDAVYLRGWSTADRLVNLGSLRS